MGSALALSIGGKAHLQIRRVTSRAGAAVYDSPGAPGISSSDPIGDQLEWVHGRGKRDSLRFSGNFDESFSGSRQQHAASITGDRVNLINDEGIDARQGVATRARGQHEVETLRRGDENLRWMAEQPTSFAGAGVTAARGDAYFRHGRASSGELRAQVRKRRNKVALYVISECLQGRNVEDASGSEACGILDQAVERPEKRRQGLAAAGGCAHQQVFASRDDRP